MAIGFFCIGFQFTFPAIEHQQLLPGIDYGEIFTAMGKNTGTKFCSSITLINTGTVIYFAAL